MQCGPSATRAIGSAIRKEQPDAKIGACAFHVPLIRDGGDLVDFVAIHAYPGSTTVSSQENLARAPEVVTNEVNKVRKLIDKYQPARKDRIEVGFTEWNLSGGLNSADLFSGLWTSSFLSAFAKNGVTFATHWDIFTHEKGMKDGHGLIFTNGKTYTRKAGYYALWLWNNFTGPDVLATTINGETNGVQTLATRDADAVYLMLLNPDYDKPARVTIKLDDFTPPRAARSSRSPAASISGTPTRTTPTGAHLHARTLSQPPATSSSPCRPSPSAMCASLRRPPCALRVSPAPSPPSSNPPPRRC